MSGKIERIASGKPGSPSHADGQIGPLVPTTPPPATPTPVTHRQTLPAIATPIVLFAPTLKGTQALLSVLKLKLR